MKSSLKYCLLLLLCCTISMASAQDAEMADVMRSEGKIYVVVAVILGVLTGLILYLVVMDRKVSRLEKKLEGKE